MSDRKTSPEIEILRTTQKRLQTESQQIDLWIEDLTTFAKQTIISLQERAVVELRNFNRETSSSITPEEIEQRIERYPGFAEKLEQFRSYRLDLEDIYKKESDIPQGEGTDVETLKSNYRFYQDQILILALRDPEIAEKWIFYPHLLGTFNALLFLVKDILRERVHHIDAQIVKIETALGDIRQDMGKAKQSTPASAGVFSGGGSGSPPPSTPTSTTAKADEKSINERALQIQKETAKRIQSALQKADADLSNPKSKFNYGGKDLEDFLTRLYGVDPRQLDYNYTVQLGELRGKYNNFFNPPTQQNQRAIGEQRSLKTFSQILHDNPTLAASIQNYALGASYIFFNQGKGQQERIALFVANQLANNQSGYADINQALLRDPAFLSQFQNYFYRRVVSFRGQAAKNGSLELFEAGDQQLKNLNEQEVISLISGIANTNIGPKGALEALNLTSREIREQIDEIKKTISTTDDHDAKSELIKERDQLELVARVQAATLLSMQNEGEDKKKDGSQSWSDQSVAERLGFTHFELGKDQIDQLSAQTYSVPELNGAMDEDTDIISNQMPEFDDNQMFTQDEFSTQRSNSPEGVAQKTQQAQNTIKNLRRAAQVARFAAGNPLAIGAGAGLGAGLYGFFTEGLATAVGAGASAFAGGTAGAILGAKIGAALGSFFGPIGTVIVGGGGAIAGGIIGGATAGYASIKTGFASSLGHGLGLSNWADIAPQALPQIPAIPAAEALGLAKGALSNAAVAGSGLGQSGLSLAGNATQAALNGAKLFAQTLPTAQTIFAGTGASSALVVFPLTVAVVGSAIIMNALTGAFLVPDQPLASESKYVSLTKTATPDKSENPETVTYKIMITPKEQYQVTITKISDVITFQSALSPAPKSANQAQLNAAVTNTPLPPEGITIQYTIDFDQSYDDTRIINTATIAYLVEGQEAGLEQTLTANATVVFGTPPTLACWPATGRIIQGPWNSSGAATHSFVDAIDIVGTLGSDIITPFSGQAKFCDENSPCAFGKTDKGIYGNHVIIYTDQGFQLIFAHLQAFAGGHKTGESIPVQAGTKIGTMGNTSSQTTSIHLHYEYRPATSQISKLEGTLPQPLEYSDKANWIVNGTQQVRTDDCSSSGSKPTGEKIGCFSFVSHTQTWTANEITDYKLQMDTMLKIPGVEKTLCQNGKEIQLVRYKSDLTDKGCQILSPGSGGAEVISDSQIAICDKLFLQYDQFGANTMWHEPGHIAQRRNADWSTHFTNQDPNYLKTYPLAKSHTEDFAESWGACLKNWDVASVQSGPISYRGSTLAVSEYTNQCTMIKNLLDAKK